MIRYVNIIFHVKKCQWLFEKENEFIEKHLDKNHKYTNVELQMLIIDKIFSIQNFNL